MYLYMCKQIIAVSINCGPACIVMCDCVPDVEEGDGQAVEVPPLFCLLS